MGWGERCNGKMREVDGEKECNGNESECECEMQEEKMENDGSYPLPFIEFGRCNITVECQDTIII